MEYVPYTLPTSCTIHAIVIRNQIVVYGHTHIVVHAHIRARIGRHLVYWWNTNEMGLDGTIFNEVQLEGFVWEKLFRWILVGQNPHIFKPVCCLHVFWRSARGMAGVSWAAVVVSFSLLVVASFVSKCLLYFSHITRVSFASQRRDLCSTCRVKLVHVQSGSSISSRLLGQSEPSVQGYR